VRYALAVAAIGATVALIAGFTIDLRVAVFGIIILFVFMAVMVVFARLASVAAGSLHVLAMVLAWAAVILVISTSILLLTSVFFNWPRPLSRWIEGTAAVTPTPAPSPIHSPIGSQSPVRPAAKVSPPEPARPSADERAKLLLRAGESSMGAGNYDDAMRKFDEALRIPGIGNEVRNELRSLRLEAVTKKHQNRNRDQK
jgi:hypothetical protein